VADCAITLADYAGTRGEAMAMGERTPLAVSDAPASGRMAVAEAITNLLAAPIASLAQVKLSCNWMAACGQPGQDAALFDAVHAVAMELCPALGIGVPVGKDSLSMHTRWQQGGEDRGVTSPVSLLVSAFAVLADVRGAFTPQLRLDAGPSVLILIDLGHGQQRMGGSILAQALQQAVSPVPDLDDAQDLLRLTAALAALREQGRVLAYHDRSDGGLWAAACEMAFAGRAGLALNLDVLIAASEAMPDEGDAKDLDRPGGRAPQRPRPARPVQRGAGRRAASAQLRPRHRTANPARAWPLGLQPRDRASHGGGCCRGLARHAKNLQ
jgi:phosphoribosylformylglycinamidine synthase (EC 6.3.5.3)